LIEQAEIVRFVTDEILLIDDNVGIDNIRRLDVNGSVG
jgi:hypothetical protein